MHVFSVTDLKSSVNAGSTGTARQRGIRYDPSMLSAQTHESKPAEYLINVTFELCRFTKKQITNETLKYTQQHMPSISTVRTFNVLIYNQSMVLLQWQEKVCELLGINCFLSATKCNLIFMLVHKNRQNVLS